jgi:predicted RNA-binding Zn-ribbon protein involved in translation (DUF1610 family)
MFTCQVEGCEEKFDSYIESNVHSSYHLYHQKIKEQGGRELEQLELRLNMPIKCPLEDKLDGDYYFPQLPKRLICSWYDCRMEFMSAENFYDHVSNHAHRTLDKCYWNGCNTQFKRVTLQIMRDHLRVHTLQKLYSCPRCGNFFSTKIKFNDHFLRHLHLSETGDVDTFTCDTCGKSFLTSSLLREHTRVHSSKNHCDQCNFVAKSASRLESHKLYRHQNERNYECTICSKSFKQRGDLRAHVKRHQIGAPYKCDRCDFETFSEEGLTKHLKLHTNQNYVCHICKKIVSRGNNLSRHLKDVHSLEPPNGLCRFRYKLTSKGLYILETVDESSLEPCTN